MVISGLKKIKKKNPAQGCVMQTLPDLQGGINVFGRIGCLDKNTEIYAEQNNKIKVIKIKNLKHNQRVLSYNFSNKKIEYKKAIKYDMGLKNVYEIELQSGKKIIATSEHRFFNKNGIEIRVDKLNSGDYLLSRQIVNANLNPWSKKEVKEKIKKILPKRKELNKKLAYKMGKANKGNSKLGLNFKTKGRKMNNKRKKMLSIAMSGNGNPMFGKISYPKKIYNKDLNHSIRSKWEETICLLLKKYNIKYQYEKRNFHLKIDRKILSYTPDLYLPKYDIYIEIKGPLYDLQFKKMKEFSKIKKLLVVGNDRYKKLNKLWNINYDRFKNFTREQIINEITKN